MNGSTSTTSRQHAATHDTTIRFLVFVLIVIALIRGKTERQTRVDVREGQTGDQAEQKYTRTYSFAPLTHSLHTEQRMPIATHCCP